MITPATHPDHFRTVTFPPHTAEYFVPIRFTLRVQEALEELQSDFTREFYRGRRAAELKDGAIDEEKFKAWQSANDPKESREFNRLYLVAKAKLFLTPKGDAPKVDSEEFWDTASELDLAQIFSFTMPMSENKNGEQPTSATNTAASPDSPAAL